MLPTSGRKIYIAAPRLGTVMGTPRYMSPEQAQGDVDNVREASDQYALGLILFEVAALAPALDPFLDLDACIIWAAMGRKNKIKHLHRRGKVPRELRAIIDKATAPDPQHRYPSVAQLAADVRRYMRDESVVAKPDNPAQQLQRWVGRNRTLMLILLLLSMLVTVAVGTFLLVAGAGAYEYRRYADRNRERVLTQGMSTTASQAARVDQRAAEIESLITGMTFLMEGAMTGPRTEVRLRFDPLKEAPPNPKHSALYGRDIVVDKPSFVFGPGVSKSSVESEVRNFVASAPEFSRVFWMRGDQPRDVSRDRDDLQKYVGTEGSPVAWLHLVAADGVRMSMPGIDAPKTAKDPRKSVWYEAAVGERDPVWAGPRIDPRGQD